MRIQVKLAGRDEPLTLRDLRALVATAAAAIGALWLILADVYLVSGLGVGDPLADLIEVGNLLAALAVGAALWTRRFQRIACGAALGWWLAPEFPLRPFVFLQAPLLELPVAAFALAILLAPPAELTSDDDGSDDG